MFPLNCLQSKFKGKQKGKHKVARKRGNASRQHLGGRKCSGREGESGVGASGNGTERRNFKRQEYVGGIQSWI